MGMADAVAELDGCMSLAVGDGEMPLGEAMEEGTIKSSRFIDSTLAAAWA